MKKIILITFILINSIRIFADDNITKIIGFWEGSLSVMAKSINIQAEFKQAPLLSGNFSIPKQGLKNADLSNIKFENDSLFFELKVAGQLLVFKSKYSENKINGIFIQGGYHGDFTMSKSIAPEQTENPNAISLQTHYGVLHGTLDLPKTKGPYPVVLVIAGSGPTDRDGNSTLLEVRNNSLKMIGDSLTKYGIAVLRYDKRGVGESMQALESMDNLTINDYINDAVEWIDKLKKDARFSSVNVLGHSEGSLIGIEASFKNRPNSFISVAGAGRSFKDIIIEQYSSAPDSIQKNVKYYFEELSAGRKISNVPKSQAYMMFSDVNQNYLISELKYNPSADIKKLQIPIMILQGTNDIQISTKDAEILAKANPKAKLKMIKNMNHVLKIAPENREDNIKTYSDPALSLAPGFIDEIVGFIKE